MLRNKEDCCKVSREGMRLSRRPDLQDCTLPDLASHASWLWCQKECRSIRQQQAIGHSIRKALLVPGGRCTLASGRPAVQKACCPLQLIKLTRGRDRPSSETLGRTAHQADTERYVIAIGKPIRSEGPHAIASGRRWLRQLGSIGATAGRRWSAAELLCRRCRGSRRLQLHFS